MTPVPQDASPSERELRAQIDALTAVGPAARHALVRLLDAGDWRARVLAASALGTLARRDASAGDPVSRLLRAGARVPGLRRHLPTLGDHAHLVSTSLAQLLDDGAFIVRAAAAAALGECGGLRHAAALEARLADPFLPVRLSAAAALHRVGRNTQTLDALRAGCDPTPEQMAEGVDTRIWLRTLAEAHHGLYAEAAAALAGARDATSGQCAAWLAGADTSRSGEGGAAAEAARYDQEADLAYQLAKPFGHHDRAENLRQLDAFVALMAHIDLPRGARIVDLAGGSGWVAELLARFGFTPIVIDVARPLLRLARQRLDERGLAGAVLEGDVTALPLATASVDAVVVMDALHHVQALDAVFAEARRVLADGGVFLIAEPGDGHAESPKSLAESREHGVRESEITPFAVHDLALRAGFSRVALIPRVPASATIDVAALRRAMLQPSGEWPVHTGGTDTRFATLALRTMLGRPLLVAHAGTRPRDTRAPGVLRAELSAAVARDGDGVRGTVTLRNTGDTTWLASTADGTGAVFLGAQRLDADGRMVDRECWRTTLPRDVAPGDACVVPVAIVLPGDTGPRRLKFDLVAEGVCWFEDRGSRAVVVTLT